MDTLLTKLLAEASDGRRLNEISQAFRRVAREVFLTQTKGKLTITLDIEPKGADELDIDLKFKETIPILARRPERWFLVEGTFTREDPEAGKDQVEMFQAQQDVVEQVRNVARKVRVED